MLSSEAPIRTGERASDSLPPVSGSREAALDAAPLVGVDDRETILRVMSAASFLIIFQAYLMAPLIPSLSVELHVSQGVLGWLVPAYLLPYGFSALIYGPLSDRIGRRPILLAMLAAITLFTAGTAAATGITSLLVSRVLCGLACGGIIPISLALFGELFAYHERGRALGWIFGAIAGGMAFGSTFGALLNPILGWRVVFLLTAVADLVVLWFAWRHRAHLEGQRIAHPPGLGVIVENFAALLRNPRGFRSYFYVFTNGAFHSGVFSWLGVYFAQRFHLGDRGIGLALLGYGVPGLLLGPALGHLADKVGRRAIIPIGIFVAAISAAALAPQWSLAWAAIAVTLLSFGFDMTHPLLAGIITTLDPIRRGQAMSLNAFALFTGYGFGSLLFQKLLNTSHQQVTGFGTALWTFAIIQGLLGCAAMWLFHKEKPAPAPALLRA